MSTARDTRLPSSLAWASPSGWNCDCDWDDFSVAVRGTTPDPELDPETGPPPPGERIPSSSPILALGGGSFCFPPEAEAFVLEVLGLVPEPDDRRRASFVVVPFVAGEEELATLVLSGSGFMPFVGEFTGVGLVEWYVYPSVPSGAPSASCA